MTPRDGTSTEEAIGTTVVFTKGLCSRRASLPDPALGFVPWSCWFLGLSALQCHGPWLLALLLCCSGHLALVQTKAAECGGTLNLASAIEL